MISTVTLHLSSKYACLRSSLRTPNRAVFRPSRDCVYGPGIYCASPSRSCRDDAQWELSRASTSWNILFVSCISPDFATIPLCDRLCKTIPAVGPALSNRLVATLPAFGSALLPAVWYALLPNVWECSSSILISLSCKTASRTKSPRMSTWPTVFERQSRTPTKSMMQLHATSSVTRWTRRGTGWCSRELS